MLWMKTRQLAKWFKRQFCPVNSPPTNQHTVVDALASICAISAAAETITNIVFVLNSSKLWVSKLEQPENGCDKILRLGRKLICDQRPGGEVMRQQGCERCCSPCSLVHRCNWSDHRSARLGCHTMKLRTIAEVHSRPRAGKMWWFTLMHLQCVLAAA